MTGVPYSPEAGSPDKHPRSYHVDAFDWLRAIAIIAVVVLHCAAATWYATPPESWDWQQLNAIDSLVRFSVPIFFMVSGALFLDPARIVTVRSILTKSLPRILIPFAAWSALYATLATFGPEGDHSLSGFVLKLVLGHYHLWFLIALAGLYLATPILKPLTAERRTLWYFAALAGVFASALPLATSAPVVGGVLVQLLDTAQLHIVLGYAVYFVLGHLIFSASISRRSAIAVVALGLAGYIATAVGTSWLSSRGNGPDDLLYGYLTPNVMLTSVGIFALASYLSHAADLLSDPPRWIKVLAVSSFGIYLVHPAFQTVYGWLGFTSAVAAPVLSIPLLATVVVIPSLLVTLAIRRVPVVRRIVS